MTPRHIQDTSRTKQETDLSVHASDPSARVLSTRGLDVLKEPDSAERFKKVSAKSKVKEKKLRPFQNGHSKSPVRIARTWTKPQPKSLDFGHLPVANSKREPNFGISPYSQCGRIWTRIGAYENQHLKL